MRRVGFRLLLVGVQAVLALLALEATGRLYFHLRRYTPFWVRPSDLFAAYYPDPAAEIAQYRPGALHVLVLGGSVMTWWPARVGPMLQRRLEERLQRPVEVINMAMTAQGTLDSYYKYREVSGYRFDLVVVYDGINELRLNNVPPALWRDDYSHCEWYEEVNAYFRHRTWASRWGTLIPFYLKAMEVAAKRRLSPRPRYQVPGGRLSAEWMRYGGTIRTAKPFRAHLERIVALAQAKKEPIVLMTIASCIPNGYSHGKFNRHELPYVYEPFSTALRVWGMPSHVAKGLRVHNAIIRRLARAHHVSMVDQAKLMGKNPRHFIDVCHLSAEGGEVFVSNIVGVAEPLLRSP